MAKPISSSRLKKLQSSGVRVLDNKESKTDSHPSITQSDLEESKQLVKEAVLRAETAEAQAIRAVDSVERQAEIMKKILESIPKQEDNSQIVGLEFHRDEKGYTKTVSFIRGKKPLH